MKSINDLDFSYSIKICKNKDGIRTFNICKHCNTANNVKRTRCIKCMRKI